MEKIIYIDSDSDNDVEMTDPLALQDDDLDHDDAFSDGNLQDEEDVELDKDFMQVMTREEYDDALAREGRLRTPSATPSPDYTHEVTLDEWSKDGFMLKPGMSIEIDSQTSSDLSLNDFFRIHSVVQDLSTDKVTLRGQILHRVRALHGMLPKHMNELAVVQKYSKEDDMTQQCLTDIPVDLAIVERKIIFTNACFPRWSFREETDLTKENWTDVKEHAVLVCRWKYVTVYKTSKSKQIEEQSLAILSEQETDEGYAVSDADTRRFAHASARVVVDLTEEDVLKNYRDSMQRIRATKTGLSQAEAVELEEEVDRGNLSITKRKETARKHVASGTRKEVARAAGLRLPSFSGSNGVRSTTENASFSRTNATSGRYTFADAFCGAAGVSRGADLAGLQLKWAFDMDKYACATYRANFSGVRCYRQQADVFIANFESGQIIDVLHLSPPCQKFSPAHTHAGKDDEANEASLFATFCLVQKCKPRVVTIEETSGILTHHPAFFHALVHQLTSLNYSVRWRIMNFAEYGRVQPRKRLVINASRAGEPLPPFPAVTHGPGLMPFTTILQATASIRSGMANHEPEKCSRKDEPAYDPNQQLRQCITTSGGQGNLHWTGKRSFTLRELASLQGFPTDHVFLGNMTEIKKQIGNAVPPPIYEAIYKEIVKSMRAVDALPEPPGSQDHPIDLD